MVCTPTYHVFELYKHHQDATLLGTFAQTQEIGMEDERIQNLSVSASEDAARTVHITIANLSANEECPVEIELLGKTGGEAAGRILTGSMRDYNDFDAPERVRVRDFDMPRMENGALTCTLPACSVVELTVS